MLGVQEEWGGGGHSRCNSASLGEIPACFLLQTPPALLTWATFSFLHKNCHHQLLELTTPILILFRPFAKRWLCRSALLFAHTGNGILIAPASTAQGWGSGGQTSLRKSVQISSSGLYKERRDSEPLGYVQLIRCTKRPARGEWEDDFVAFQSPHFSLHDQLFLVLLVLLHGSSLSSSSC